MLELGYQIIAVSPDKPEKLPPTEERNSVKYTLVSDSQAEAIQAFGLAFRVDDSMVERLKGYNIDLEEHSGAKHHILPVPAVFLVGKEGKVLFHYVNPDYRVRLHSDIILAAAKAHAGD